MAYIAEALRKLVTERARGLCEYCQTAMLIVVTVEIDHIVPEASGGETTADNLCLVCRACNSYKQDHQSGFDPVTGIETALFNPRTQNWPEHFRWDETGTRLIGLSAEGRATINRLRINRDAVVASRRLWVEAGWHPPQAGHFPSLQS